jgi:hypothetical protein
MGHTLYEPPVKPLVRKKTLKILLILFVVAGAGGYLYQRQPGWFANVAAGILGFFGHETVTVEVTTSPTSADLLLDGERVTDLPLHVRKDGAIHQVSAVAPGYQLSEVPFRADGDKHLFLTLRPGKRR